MKVRTDFVSNSSSSSFVFSADFKKFGFDDFVKAVCDECDGGENDERIRNNNKAVLMYCLRYFELLHLGRLVRGRKKEIIRRGYDYDGSKIEDEALLDSSQFEIVKRTYIDDRPEYDDENTSVRMVDADTIEYEYDDFAPDRIVVLRHYMSDVIRRGPWAYGEKVSEAKARKDRVKEIMRAIEQAEAAKDDCWRTTYRASTFLITKNTISNTRDLIAACYDVRLAKWENLDALEARISAGETVFHIECGDAGEGEDDTRLFSNASQYPFKDLPLEEVRGGDW